MIRKSKNVVRRIPLYCFRWNWRKASVELVYSNGGEQNDQEAEAIQYTAAEEIAILRQHLLEDVPVSELCDQHELQPTVFYRWQKQLFEQGAVVFETRREPAQRRRQRQVAQLTAKVHKKNEVLSELMEEYVELKKALGAP